MFDTLCGYIDVRKFVLREEEDGESHAVWYDIALWRASYKFEFLTAVPPSDAPLVDQCTNFYTNSYTVLTLYVLHW